MHIPRSMALTAALFTATSLPVAVVAIVVGNASATPAAPTASASVRADGVAHPSWASGLGPGAVVYSPAPAKAGSGSPAAAVAGLIELLNAKKPVQACRYYEPSFQAGCRKALKTMPASEVPTVKGFGIGYVVVDGKEALVGSTGTYCVPGETPLCVANHNPAAVLSDGKDFKKLWYMANNTSSANTYSPAPAIEIGHLWYDYVPPAT